MLEHLMSLLSSPWLYVLVAVAVAIDGVVPVVPSEAMVIGLGALSATGTPDLPALVAAAVAGGVAGDRVAYLLGRKAGARVCGGRIAAAKARAEQALLRHGGVALLIGRFLPYGRTATTMTSGSVSLPLGRFGVFSLLASLCWALYSIGLGRLGGMAFAGSPLLGAAFGLLIGSLLAGVYGFGERRRAARRGRVSL